MQLLLQGDLDILPLRQYICWKEIVVASQMQLVQYNAMRNLFLAQAPIGYSQRQASHTFSNLFSPNYCVAFKKVCGVVEVVIKVEHTDMPLYRCFQKPVEVVELK